MKGSDRAVLIVLPILALAMGFYFLVVSPKRAEISDLDAQASDLQVTLASSEAEILAAEAARSDYDSNYADVVSLGAAAPEDSGQATFVYELSALADRNDVQMRSFELVEGAGEGVAPAPAEAPVAPADPAAPAAPADGAATVTAPATETAVATAPLGASVGPAGLPVMPYTVRYGGSFFEISDLFGGLNSTVEVKDTVDVLRRPKVEGRLVTVDGFALVGDPVYGFPLVQASIALKTYGVPAEQGISAGASPAAPPATVPGTEVPTGTDPTSPVGATAAVIP